MFYATRACAFLLAALLASACGGSDDDGGTPISPTPPPAAPAPPPSGVAVISGNWNGTAGFQQNGIQYVSNFTATIAQNDRNISGTVRFTSPGWESWQASVSGTVAGTSPDTQFIGDITMRAAPTTGTGMCEGSMRMAGRSIANSMRWDAPELSITNNTPTQPLHSCMGTVFTPNLIFFR